MQGGLAQVTVGLWLESWTQPAWRARALRLLVQRADVRIAYVSVVDALPSTRPVLNRLLRQLLLRDHRRAIRYCPDAFAPEDVRSLLAGVPLASAPGAPADVDVLIQLGRGAPPPTHVAATRVGLWRFDADPGHLLDELPVGFWDVVDGRETLTTVLRMQDQSGGPGGGARNP